MPVKRKRKDTLTQYVLALLGLAYVVFVLVAGCYLIQLHNAEALSKLLLYLALTALALSIPLFPACWLRLVSMSIMSEGRPRNRD